MSQHVLQYVAASRSKGNGIFALGVKLDHHNNGWGVFVRRDTISHNSKRSKASGARRFPEAPVEGVFIFFWRVQGLMTNLSKIQLSLGVTSKTSTVSRGLWCCRTIKKEKNGLRTLTSSSLARVEPSFLRFHNTMFYCQVRLPEFRPSVRSAALVWTEDPLRKSKHLTETRTFYHSFWKVTWITVIAEWEEGTFHAKSTTLLPSYFSVISQFPHSVLHWLLANMIKDQRVLQLIQRDRHFTYSRIRAFHLSCPRKFQNLCDFMELLSMLADDLVGTIVTEEVDSWTESVPHPGSAKKSARK